jgi:hypothetical protein
VAGPNLSLSFKLKALVEGASEVRALGQAVKDFLKDASAKSTPFAKGLQAEARAATDQLSKMAKKVTEAKVEMQGFGGEVNTAKASLAQLVALAVAGFSVASFVKAGIDFNKTIEDSVLGIASLVNAQTKITDGQGNQLKGQEALTAAIALSEGQMLELRRAGLETAATTTQLVEAYQQAVGAGLGAGLALDDIRKITIQTTQAAAALGVPMNQINQEVRSILSGQIDSNSAVAKALGITNEQVNAMKAQGKLVEFLDSKMGAFSDAAKRSSDNFTVLASNASEVIDVFAGSSTEKFFDAIKAGLKSVNGLLDPKTLGVDQSLTQITVLFNDLGGVVGGSLGSAFEGLIGYAKDFGVFLEQNQGVMIEIVAGTESLLQTIGSVVGYFIDATSSLTGWSAQTGIIEKSFSIITLFVASIQDGFTVIAAAVVGLGGTIVNLVLAPLELVLRVASDIGEAFGLKGSQNVKLFADEIERLRTTALKAAADMIEPIAAGEGAVAKATTRIRENTAMREFSQNLTRSLTEGIKPAQDAADARVQAVKDGLNRELAGLKAGLDSKQLTQKQYDDQVMAANKAASEKTLQIQREFTARSNAYVKSKLDQELAQLEAGHAKGLISEEQYQKRKAEIEAQVKKRVVVDKTAGLSITPNDRPKTDAEVREAQSRAKALQAINKEALAGGQQALEEAYANQKITTEQYYAGREAYIKAQIALERKAIDDPTNQSKNKDLEKQALLIKEGNLLDANNAKLQQALKSETERVDALKQAVLNQRGDEQGAQSIAVESQYQRYIALANTLGEANRQAAQALADEYKATETELIRLRAGRTAQEREYSAALGDLQVRVAELATAQAQGSISAAAADLKRKELLAEELKLQQDKLVQLQALKVSYDSMGASGAAQSAATLQQITQTKIGIEGLKQDLADNQWLTSLQGQLGNLFNSVLTGGANAESAIKGFFGNVFTSIVNDFGNDMAKSLTSGLKDAGPDVSKAFDSILSNVADMASKLFSQIAEAMSSSSGGSAGGSSWMTAVAAAFGFSRGGLVKGYASGGLINGPGTGTSDSIPARLSKGEYVVKARAVKKIGVGFLDAINGGPGGPTVMGGVPAFASGGLVDNSQGMAGVSMNPTIYIDSRTDAGQVQQLVVQGMRQSQKQMWAEMKARGIAKG